MVEASVVSRYALGGSSLLALRRKDFIFAGYYRSGTTWTRIVLANLISLNELGGRDVDEILNDIMPELGVNSLFRPWSHPTMPRVIKTHRRYSPLFRRARSFGVIRDPRDIMVSRYHKRRDHWGDFASPFGEFIRHPRFGLEDWWAHYMSWQQHWVLTVKYEDMLEDPHREFARLVDALGVACSDEMLSEAIERSSFRSLQLAEKQRKPSTSEGALHFRSGSSGQWQTYFDEDDLAYYRELAAKYDEGLYP